MSMAEEEDWFLISCLALPSLLGFAFSVDDCDGSVW